MIIRNLASSLIFVSLFILYFISFIDYSKPTRLFDSDLSFNEISEFLFISDNF